MADTWPSLVPGVLKAGTITDEKSVMLSKQTVGITSSRVFDNVHFTSWTGQNVRR